MANLGPRIAQGVAITAQGGRVKGLGINLLPGFSPRAYIDNGAIEQMDRKGQIWAHGASLLLHLSVFVFGILIWAGPRDSGGIVPLMTLTMAKFGLIMFLITGWPSITVDGMRFKEAALNEPKLLAQSLMAAHGLFLKGHMPPMINRADAWPLAPFAVGTLLTTLLVLGVAALFILIALQDSLGGLRVIIFLGLMTVATLWFMTMFQLNQRTMKGGMGGATAAGMGGDTARALRSPDQPEVEGERSPARGGPAAATAPGRAMPKTDLENLPNHARAVR